VSAWEQLRRVAGQSGGGTTQSALLSGNARRQNGDVSTQSAIRPSAQPRSRKRRRLGMTRGNPNDPPGKLLLGRYERRAV
jgi:hypothetical protein